MSAPLEEVQLPLLAVPFRHGALSPWALSESAAGLCRLLWLVGSDAPPDAVTSRLLRRFGAVVDLSSTPPGRWPAIVGPFAPDGLLVVSDHDMVELAGLASSLGLRFNSPQTARNLTDKTSQRAALAAAGLPTPRLAPINSGADRPSAERALDRVGLPAVLKPQRGGDSRLTYRISEERELHAALRALEGDGLGALASPFPMVLEEYLSDAPAALGSPFANYLSVESIVHGDIVDHLAITGRFPPAEPFRERGFFIPSTASPPLDTELLDLADAAARALGVDSGALHTEIKLTADGPRVIEVNGRLGGGIPAMLELASGTSAIRLAMSAALGSPPDTRGPRQCTTVAYRLLVQGPTWARGVESVEGLDRVGGFPGVAAVALHRGPGSSIDWRTGNHDYVFSVLGVVPDHDALATLERSVASSVVVTYR